MNSNPPTASNPPSAPLQPGGPDDPLDRLMNGPSGILILAALILGVLSFAMFYLNFSFAGLTRRLISPHTPPSFLAVTLSFFVIMMAVTSIYRIRRLPGQFLARTAAILALLLGLLGPLVYQVQSLRWHQITESQETQNVEHIAQVAREYAQKHGGDYPPNFAVLLADGSLSPEALISPFPLSSHDAPAASRSPAMGAALTPAAIKAAVDASDYEYVGGDLKLSYSDKVIAFDHQAIVVVANEPRMGDFLFVAFADGGSTMLKLDQVEAAFDANDAVREKVGLPKLTRPAVVNPNAATNPATNP